MCIWVFHAAQTFSPDLICLTIPSLNAQQKALCRQLPKAMNVLVNATLAYTNECNWQFRKDRWNCSAGGIPIFANKIAFNSEWVAGMGRNASRAAICRLFVVICEPPKKHPMWVIFTPIFPPSHHRSGPVLSLIWSTSLLRYQTFIAPTLKHTHTHTHTHTRVYRVQRSSIHLRTGVGHYCAKHYLCLCK